MREGERRRDTERMVLVLVVDERRVNRADYVRSVGYIGVSGCDVRESVERNIACRVVVW